MVETYFEILRPGLNTTIQDRGRNHLFHVGITVSGAQGTYVAENILDYHAI